MDKKILCTVPLKDFPETCEIMNRNNFVTYLEYPNYNDVLRIINNFDGLFPNAKMSIDKKLIDNASKLKVISMPGMGTDHIDMKYCSEKGVKVFSLSDAKDFMSTIPSTAEYTVGLILSLLKKYHHSMKSVVEDNLWLTSKFRGFNLKNKIVGIIGYGVIGKQVSNMLKVFDAKVIVNDPYLNNSDYNINFVTIETLLKNSEIITVHVPLNDETKNLIDRNNFSLMNQTYFINASRGGVIDDSALIWALEAGKVKAAALDVLTDESNLNFESNVLIQYAKNNDNLIITPHCAGSSFDGLKRIFKYSAEILIKNLLEN